MLSVYFCDDNPIILEKYSKLLEGIAAKNGIEVNIRTFLSGEQLLIQLEKNAAAVDILYMDILMGKMNGVETAKKLRSLGCQAEIIYLTSSEEYVFDSFDTNPLQYILKSDADDAKFEQVFLKAASLIDKRSKDIFVATKQPVTKAIPMNDISYFEVQNRVVTVHYGNNETFDFYSTLDQIEKDLADKNFIRTHRAYLVNLRHVDRIERDKITLVGGTVIPLGITYASDFKERFADYLTTNM